MAKAIFDVAYNNGTPSLPPMKGPSLHLVHNDGDGFSVLSDVSLPIVRVLVTTDRPTIAAMKADPAYSFVEDVPDDYESLAEEQAQAL